MLNKLKNTLKHSAVYSIGNISNKLVGFILLPLYAKNLTISEYGMWGLIEATSQIMITIGGLRLQTAMMRWLADANTTTERKTIVSTVLLMVFIAIAFIATIGYLYRDLFSNSLLNSSEYIPYINIMILMIVVSIYNQIPLQLFRHYEKSVKYVLISLIRLGITLISTIIFITKYNMRIDGILYGQVLGMITMSVLSLSFLLKNITLRFNNTLAREMIQYSYPLVFTTISAMLLNLGDRFILKYYGNFATVGQYSLGFKIASVVNVFVIQSFQMGYLPIAFKMCDKPEAKRFYSKILLYFLLLIVFLVLIVSILSKEIIIILTNNLDYVNAYIIVPIISLVFIAKGMQYVFSIGLHCVKKTKYNIIAVTVGTVTNLILNFIFIPVGGMFAAAITSVISGFIVAFIFYYYAQKFFPIPYDIRKILSIFISAAIIYILSIQQIFDHYILLIIYKTGLILLFPIFLYFLNFYEPIELLRIKQTWEKWRHPGNWKKNIAKIKLK